ncbi:hypothetical protein Droror1_Dr00017620 [Drosera rotundifolia]
MTKDTAAILSRSISKQTLVTAVLIMLFLSPDSGACIGHKPTCPIPMVAAASRPLSEDSSRGCTTLNNENARHGFSEKELEISLPKGFRRSSAPSRYTNSMDSP